MISPDLIEMTPEDLKDPGTQEIYQKLLMQAQEAGYGTPENTPQSRSVVPQPGFCLKTKSSDGKKVFINVCHSEGLPKPPAKTDDEVMELISSDDPSGYRIPMSLGEPHAELDKAGQGATAYDVVVNHEFFKELENRHVLLGFFITVVLGGLEHKNDMELSREWKMLKNRKFVGSLPEQNIRTKSKPLIMEVDADKKPLISEVTTSDSKQKSKAPEPGYTILQEPVTGHPEFLVAEIHLPKVKTAATVTLDIGEDRILLETRSNVYGLDIYLPFTLIQDECVSQFNRKTKILTVTMPVQPELS